MQRIAIDDFRALMRTCAIAWWPLGPLAALGTGCVGFYPDAPPLDAEAEGSTTTDTSSGGESTMAVDTTTAASATTMASADATTATADVTGTNDTSSTSTSDDASTTTGGRPSCNDGPTPADELAFGPPIPLPGVNTASNELNAWLSADELEVWLTTDRPEGVGGYDVFRSTRDDPAAAFGPAMLLAGMSTVAAQEQVHSLSADALTLYGASDGIGSIGAFDVMVATRPNALAEFSALAPIANINSGVSDSEPSISADGTELYFSSIRTGTWDLYRALLGAGGTFGAPVPIGELNMPDAGEGNAVVSADGLTIYFASTRDDPAWDVYAATRSTRDDAFGPPVSMMDVNTSATDLPVWLSSDGCRLVLGSDRPGEGGYDLWIAEREP